MQKYPYLILTVFLFAILVFPFIFKLKDERLEIYPAIIFPSGHRLIDTPTDSLSIYSIEIYGCKKEGKEERISPKNFLGSIPNHFLFVIAEGNFGLEQFQQEFKLYKPPVTFQLANHYNRKSVESTKIWIKNRLKDNGFNDHFFIYKTTLNTYSKKDNSLKGKAIIDEKIFALD